MLCRTAAELRTLRAGELVSKQCAPGLTCPCIFEYIYLARPDSVLNDISVYNFQRALGRCLAQRVRCGLLS